MNFKVVEMYTFLDVTDIQRRFGSVNEKDTEIKILVVEPEKVPYEKKLMGV